MSEKPISPESNETPKKVYDEELYSQFSNFGSFEAYEYLNGDADKRKEQRDKFMSGEVKNPTFDYPDIDLEKLNSFEFDLLSIKKSLLLDESNEMVVQAYRPKLNEKIAEVRMLKAVASGDIRRFKRYGDFIYGKPSPDIYSYTINSIRNEAETATKSDNESLKQSAEILLLLLPTMESPVVYNLPDKDTVADAKEQTEKEFGDLINLPPETKSFTDQQIKEAFEGALSAIGASEEWGVIIKKTNKIAISVNQETTQIVIPEGRKVTRNKLEQLIIHEIFTHPARRINGERSSLKLLGLGLDRYIASEEGMAKIREISISGEFEDFGGLDGMLSVGLATGLDGEPRDFRGVYNILSRYYTYDEVKKGKSFEEARKKGQEKAWDRASRTFRGTDCKTPGICYTKDMVYREGSIGIWDVIKKHPEEMTTFNIGKFDPSNERHNKIIKYFIQTEDAITDNDLDQLEK